jgi:hypothetical protein
MGALVGQLPGPTAPWSTTTSTYVGHDGGGGQNGCIFDTTFNFFAKYKYAHTYDGMLATPLSVDDGPGELTWALLRGVMQATAFFPHHVGDGAGALPVGRAVHPRGGAHRLHCGAGLGLTTYMRSFFDFDYVGLAIVPLFLFSATFFPLDQYPPALEWIVRISPSTRASPSSVRWCWLTLPGAAAARRLSGRHGLVRPEGGGAPPGPNAAPVSADAQAGAMPPSNGGGPHHPRGLTLPAAPSRSTSPRVGAGRPAPQRDRLAVVLVADLNALAGPGGPGRAVLGRDGAVKAEESRSQWARNRSLARTGSPG